VHQLAARGVVGLADPLGKYLPQFPEPAKSTVTVQHLLDHRSGWGAYWDNPTWLARRRTLKTVAGYMDFIKDVPLGFEPGTREEYSNTGYEVLGAIVEAASGRSYYDYVRTEIYERAGMRDTDAYERDAGTPNLALGYVGPDRSKTNDDMMAIKGTPAGGGYSTAGDMLRFARALRAGSLVPEPFASRYRGRGVGGGAPGVNAMLEMGVAGDHTVIVLSNLDPPSAEQVAGGIGRMLRAGQNGTRALNAGTNRSQAGAPPGSHKDRVATALLPRHGRGRHHALDAEVGDQVAVVLV
jgi:CubicO group peptidase (beta-lactamase class C family)